MLRMHGRTDRFLTRGMALALAIVGIFSLTFSRFQVKGDGLVYFNLLRRFFGEHPDFAFAYQFGSDIWNAPFFLVGRGLGAIFGFQPKIFHVSFEELSMAVAAQTAFVATLYLGWRLLRELDLPRGPFVLLATAFGSPLFYYVFFEPAAKHAVDTLVITAAALLVAQLFSRPSARGAVALGALAGVSLNVRYVNLAFFLAIACGFALRNQFRTLGLAAAAAVIVGPGIFALPALRGIPYFVPAYFPKSQAAVRTTAGTHPLLGGASDPLNGFDPLIPLKMLFSEHRGLFLWSPLTALATIGFVLALRRETLSDRRAFFWTLAAAALALLCVHTIWGQWDGGFAYSQRFLTSLFPLFLIGVAELRRGWRRLLYPALTVCVAWSLAVAFVHDIGYDGSSEADGIDRIARVLQTEHGNLRHKIDERATKRWQYVWGLLHGRDPEHVNGH
jgi:hypothetical protein